VALPKQTHGFFPLAKMGQDGSPPSSILTEEEWQLQPLKPSHDHLGVGRVTALGQGNTMKPLNVEAVRMFVSEGSEMDKRLRGPTRDE
jgi:hypothetical protein